MLADMDQLLLAVRTGAEGLLITRSAIKKDRSPLNFTLCADLMGDSLNKERHHDHKTSRQNRNDQDYQ
jgi:hypothetical protein